jgi:tetratricopeptide (TPR) repeat protein
VIASRHEPARLMLIGTCLPPELQPGAHPLRAVEKELLRHGRSQRLSLGLLTESAVADYLGLRFSRTELPDNLARLVHARSEGNPLFMVDLVNHLIEHGAIIQTTEGSKLQLDLEKFDVGVPENVRDLIEGEIEALSDEDQHLLEAASVVGIEVSAASIAAALNSAIEEVEQRCDALERHGHLLKQLKDTEWPDGTVAACYGFIHQLYQKVVYERITVGQRIRLHRRVGERMESAFAGNVSAVACQLAIHFEAARDWGRAVRYLELAAKNALGRDANREAAELLIKAIQLLGKIPDSADRTRTECTLQTTLGPVLAAVKGYTAPEIGVVYARARYLSESIGAPAQLGRALRGLFVINLVRGEFLAARELGDQLLVLAQSEPECSIEAHYALAAAQCCIGEFSAACEHAEQAIALYDPAKHRSHAQLYGQEPGVFSRMWASMALWFLGYPDRALNHSREAQILAREVGHPFTLSPILLMTAILHQLRREPAIAQQHIAAAIALAEEQGFSFFSTYGTLMKGWILTVEGHDVAGIEHMYQANAALDAMKVHWYQPYNLALLAEAYAHIGRSSEGLTVLQEALVAGEASGQHFYDAEIYRLQGELTLQNKPGGKRRRAREHAEHCFTKAISVARSRGAKSLQLRAAISLGRLWLDSRKRPEARRRLDEVHRSFSEGFGTADLIEAKTLLAELS